jgi:hypothetical protein
MNPVARRRRRVAIEAAMWCIVILLVAQMWLLTATLEGYLAGHHQMAGPAFAASLVLAGIAGTLYVLVLRLDRTTGPDEPPPSSSGPWELR